MLSLLDEQLFLVRMGTFLLILCGGLIGFFFLNRIINRREAVQENRWMPEQDLPVDYDEADGELDWEEAEEEYEEEETLMNAMATRSYTLTIPNRATPMTPMRSVRSINGR